MQPLEERTAILNDRANDFFGFFLHGLGDTGDCAEAERTYREFQDELCAGPLVSIDSQACDAWLDSHSAADVFAHTEE